MILRSKPLWVMFDKVDEFIRIYDSPSYLTLLDSEKYYAICNRVRYHVSLKSGTTYICSHYYTKIKVDSYDFLPKEKRLTLNNVIVFFKLVLNKDKNHYH